MGKRAISASNRKTRDFGCPQGVQKFRVAACAFCIALAVSLLLYYPAMSGGFLFDDLLLPFRKSLAHEPITVWLSGVRPMLMFTYWLNYSLSGASPAPYHVVNSIIHALNAFLAFLVILKLLELAGWTPRRALWAAAAGSALFLVHPLQTESVSYVAGRSESLAAFFSLCAYAFFLYRRGGGLTWRDAALILGLFALAVASKEHSVALLCVFVLTDIFWPQPFSAAGLRRNWRLYALMLPGGAVALAFILAVLSQSGQTAGFSVAGVTWYQYGFTEARALFKYAAMFFVPLGQCIDHDFPVSYSITDHGAAFFVAAVAGLIAAAILFRRRHPAGGIWGVFVPHPASAHIFDRPFG